jgi:hypothetical protein
MNDEDYRSAYLKAKKILDILGVGSEDQAREFMRQLEVGKEVSLMFDRVMEVMNVEYKEGRDLGNGAAIPDVWRSRIYGRDYYHPHEAAADLMKSLRNGMDVLCYSNFVEDQLVSWIRMGKAMVQTLRTIGMTNLASVIQDQENRTRDDTVKFKSQIELEKRDGRRWEPRLDPTLQGHQRGPDRG